MIEEQIKKNRFQESTNYNTVSNTTQQTSNASAISQYKEHILKSKNSLLGYVSKVFNDIKNHAVRFQISKINSSYTFKPIQKQGVINLECFIQNLVIFYKKSIQKAELETDFIQKIVRFGQITKKELEKSKDELQSDSDAVKNIQRLSHIIKTTFINLLECFEVRNLALTDYLKYVQILRCLLAEIRQMMEGENFIQRIGYYDPYSMPTTKQTKDQMAQTIKSPRSVLSVKYEEQHQSSQHHYFPKQRIHFDKQFSTQAIDYIYPSHHRVYICEAAKAYSTITPIRINKINIDRFPRFENYDTIFDISNDSYFQGQQTVPIVYHLIPNTNKMSYYNLEAIEKALNLTHQYQAIKEMPIEGNFTEYSQSCINPYGSIFLTNVNTTNKKYDLNFWQYKFNSEQIKKRVPLSSPRKQHGMVFLNNSIFLIGGSSPTSKALKTVQKYNIKTKQWSSAGSMQVGVTNPTVCTFRNRYIFSCCGFNQFDFISNRFQVYDFIFDGWTIVKTVTNNQFKSLELLNGGSAVAINPEVIYIFGGNKSTGFQHDTDLALMINEVVEVKKKPSRVSGELIPTGGEKRNILSYAGVFKPNSGVVHNNSLYFLRKDIY